VGSGRSLSQRDVAQPNIISSGNKRNGQASAVQTPQNFKGASERIGGQRRPAAVQMYSKAVTAYGYNQLGTSATGRDLPVAYYLFVAF
jgi:hypothetical protein